ncbi:MAG TPA: hypothetical protein VJT49_10560 [Amycolatopsis sp.]|uniref:hypothetical protein n=1 Tax=Amycolatopsis sp. TaxID=37632 RepID=UPI002B46242B|nr:hypothetical protein [Amycolatopsis sp.]HKS45536.1 hypothetical protein [Amycolatopsis sp.]
MTLPDEMPAGLATPDEITAWVNNDLYRANLAWWAEMARLPAARRQVVFAALSAVLLWPMPDTPPAEVLANVGRAGLPVADALMREEARPPHMRRPELIAQLRTLATGNPNATAINPPTGHAFGGPLFGGR